MTHIVDAINGILWGGALIYLCLGAGLYFSVRTGFVQIRGLAEMVRLMFVGRGSAAGVSSFQALAMSLAGRVGIGNIAGVATAITFGGPGAVFWMWMSALLGASTSYIECTLAQIYKEKDGNGRYRGGPAYYIEKAMNQKWYACVFAFASVVATGFLLPGVQANGIAASVATAWGVSPVTSATVIVVLLAFIILGGVTRIARFSEIVVPVLALGYILMAVVITLANAAKVPLVLALIVNSAFGAEAAFGAVLGLAVEWGVKRGVYSNEAGQGTGPHSAAAAEVSHPAKQGYVQAFSIYVDTLLVCSATALMILLTDSYNVSGPGGSMLLSHLPGVETGPAYTQVAVESMMPTLGASFVALAIMFSAFTTIVAFYYMAETNVQYLNRKTQRPWTLYALRLAIVVSVAYGSLHSANRAWALGDLGVGLMAWLNIIAVLIVQRPALLALKDYEAQRKAGRDPVFDPDRLGIRGAELWSRSARK